MLAHPERAKGLAVCLQTVCDCLQLMGELIRGGLGVMRGQQAGLAAFVRERLAKQS